MQGYGEAHRGSAEAAARPTSAEASQFAREAVKNLRAAPMKLRRRRSDCRQARSWTRIGKLYSAPAADQYQAPGKLGNLLPQRGALGADGLELACADRPAKRPRWSWGVGTACRVQSFLSEVGRA